MHLNDPILYLTLAVYALAVYNCFQILGDRQSPSATFAWIMLTMGLPVVGVLLYYLFGKDRIRGYIKRRNIRNLEFSGHARNQAQVYAEGQKQAHIPPEIEGNLKTFRRIFRRFGPEFEPQPSQLELLVDGKATFESIFSAIGNAKHYILVQYYILRSDRLGREFKQLLISKAKSGLPVYLLYDDMGSFWLKQDFIKDLLKAGVKVAKFLPVRSLKRGFQINFRNHRKLVVVDGICAFTGGLNIGEEYIERRRRRRRYSFAFWRDTHVKIVGPTVAQLQEIFLEDWHFATHEALELKPADPKVTMNSALASTADPEPYFVQVVPSQPTDEVLIGVLLFMQIIQSAQQRLWIATPYFVPDTPLLRELELAALRGVDIRLILPRKSDNQFVHWVTLSYAEQLQSIGIKVCLYEAGFMHQKVAIVDQTMTILGTTNFDNRALYLNFETTLVIHGEAFNKKVEAVLRNDLANCRFHQPAKIQPDMPWLSSARTSRDSFHPCCERRLPDLWIQAVCDLITAVLFFDWWLLRLKTMPLEPQKTLNIRYFAALRERAGRGEEAWPWSAGETPASLFAHLASRYQFPMELIHVRVAVNDEFASIDTLLQAGDRVVFIPPVAGG